MPQDVISQLAKLRNSQQGYWSNNFESELTDDEANVLKEAINIYNHILRIDFSFNQKDKGETLDEAITELLSGYDNRGFSETDLEMQMFALNKNIMPYPAWAAQFACKEHARTNKFRPNPADLVALAEQAVAKIRREKEQLELLLSRRKVKRETAELPAGAFELLGQRISGKISEDEFNKRKTEMGLDA